LELQDEHGLWHELQGELDDEVLEEVLELEFELGLGLGLVGARDWLCAEFCGNGPLNFEQFGRSGI